MTLAEILEVVEDKASFEFWKRWMAWACRHFPARPAWDGLPGSLALENISILAARPE